MTEDKLIELDIGDYIFKTRSIFRKNLDLQTSFELTKNQQEEIRNILYDSFIFALMELLDMKLIGKDPTK